MNNIKISLSNCLNILIILIMSDKINLYITFIKKYGKKISEGKR